MNEKGSNRKLTLFPYQRNCVEIIKKASASKEKILLSIAPGFGRTAIITQTLRELIEAKRLRHTLLVAPRLDLLHQFSHFFSEYSLENIILTLNSIKNDATDLERMVAPICLSSLPTLRKGITRLTSNFFDIVFLDECHTMSDNDLRIVGNLESTVVGLTTNHPYFINSKLKNFFRVQRPTFSYGISTLKLKDLANVFTGINYSSADLQDIGKWKFIRPRDIKKNQILEAKTFISDKLAKTNPRSKLTSRDILLQNIFNFSSMAIVRKENLPAVASKNFFIIRPKIIGSDFLFDYLQSKTIRTIFQKQLEELAHGAIIRHITLKDIIEIPIPVPFSDEYLGSFGNLEQYDYANLEKARDMIKQLIQAFREYSGLERG